MAPPIGKPRGVLRTASADGVFALDRQPPPDDLAGFIEHFWMVSWQVPGEPVRSEVLSHPSVHIVLEAGSSRVFGVPRGRFTRVLEGTGSVFGIKFRPGAFRPLIDGPVAQLTDQSIPLERMLGARAGELDRAVLSLPATAARVAPAVSFLRDFLPPLDPVADQVAGIVNRILDDREILRVEHIARITGMSPRALQRLFHNYVGVSPKWVIRRYRMHEVIERMDADPAAIQWSSLAHDLGYFDQAHFNRDFKLLVGRSPTGYAQLARTTASPASRSVRGYRLRPARPVHSARSARHARSAG